MTAVAGFIAATPDLLRARGRVWRVDVAECRLLLVCGPGGATPALRRNPDATVVDLDTLYGDLRTSA